jgi:hypothetical protein
LRNRYLPTNIPTTKLVKTYPIIATISILIYIYKNPNEHRIN